MCTYEVALLVRNRNPLRQIEMLTLFCTEGNPGVEEQRVVWIPL